MKQGRQSGGTEVATDADLTATGTRQARAEAGAESSSVAAPASSPVAAVAESVSPGQPVIEHFIMLSRLGQGGMGVVFAAYDERLDRKVAIKLMQPGRESVAARGRMLQEARAMAKLSHPNIVTVHEVGEVGTQIFIAMEHVRGLDLNAWLLASARAWPEVLEVFMGAGQGLRAAHEAGLIHRDFKPHNVMVGDDGSVKVLDFGLAREDHTLDDGGTTVGDLALEQPWEAGPQGLTRTGAVVGTPAYMAPEVHRGDAATARSDQFSFCVALYFGLFGVYPFEGGNVVAVVDAILSGRVREPPADNAVPLWLRRAVTRGLALEPAERFESMAQLLAALAEDPDRRRRRRLWGGAAVATIFAGGFAVAQLGVDAAEPCPDGRELVAASWSDEHRASVEKGVLASGSAHALDTWERVAPALDRYVDDWVAGYDDACRRHHDGLQSDALYDRRVACLQQRRTGLQTLIEVFEQADSAVVDKAVTAVANLPSLGRCADVEALLAEVAPPPDAIAERVATLRDTLARARVHEDAGRYQRAAQLSDEVLDEAAALDYAPLRVEGLLRRGSTAMAAGQGADADRDLAEAIWGGLEAGHDPVAARAATLRVYARAELLGHPSEAATELPWAEAMVTRAADESLRGLFLNNAGAVHLRNGEPQRALDSFRASLDLREAVLPPGHPDLALSLANLGRAELSVRKTAAASESLREAATRIEAALGPLHPHRALVATIYGAALTDLGRWAEAEAELAVADRIYSARPDDGPMSRYHVLRARGGLAMERRRYLDAQATFREALDLAVPAVGAEHPMLVDAKLGLAHAQVALGERASGLALARETVEAFGSTVGVEHPYMNQARLVLGQIELAAGDAASARQHFSEVVEAERAADDADPVEVAVVEVWLARALVAQGSDEAAAKRLEASVAVLAQALPASARPLVEARIRLAETRAARGDTVAAAALLGEARDGLAGSRAPDDPELAWVRALAIAAQARAGGAMVQSAVRAEVQPLRAALVREPGWSAEVEWIDRWLAGRAATPLRLAVAAADVGTIQPAP